MGHEAGAFVREDPLTLLHSLATISSSIIKPYTVVSDPKVHVQPVIWKFDNVTRRKPIMVNGYGQAKAPLDLDTGPWNKFHAVSNHRLRMFSIGLSAENLALFL